MDSQISLIINTLNEENNLRDCILSARNLVDEIIVCDMYSDDATVLIAEELGARIIYHEPTEFVEPARRFAISCASHPWILVLDADERLTPNLSKKLAEISKRDDVDLVLCGILYNYFAGYVWHGGFYDTHFPRFFRKQVYLDTYQPEEAIIHHNFLTIREAAQRKLQLPPEFFILHEAYPTIEKYIQKTLGMYARLEAEQRVRQKEKFQPWRIFWEPTKEFLARFLRLKGYRDGWRGLILAILYSGFRFTVWANIWFLTETHEDKQKTIGRVI